MGIRTHILRPVAFLGALHAKQQLGQFLRAHRQTRQAQRSLLQELVERHAQTDFGRDHGLGRVRTVEDFRSAVPVGNYETLRPYMERVLAGQTTALLPAGEEVLMFSMTSGTTGSPKYIPVTGRFLADIRRGWNMFGVKVLSDHPRAWLRPLMQISSPMREAVSPTGLACGAISGMLAATQKRIVRRMYVVPQGAYEIADATDKYYTILRCGVTRDVAFITTANPSSTIKLIEAGQAHAERLIRDVRDGTLRPPGGGQPNLGLKLRPRADVARRMERGIARDGVLLPGHFWNLAFLTNWTGGTLRLYLRRLRELFGQTPIRDIGLLASEGRFSVPLEDETAAGVAEILGNFLEFIPADQADEPNPPTLLADELEIGQEYSLVVTNWAGLWRYHMDDRVRVTGRLGQSPVFEFLSRGKHTANMTGEKLTEHQVVQAMHRAVAATGLAVQRFVVQGRFADIPYYELRLESPGGGDVASLVAQMDRELCQLNIEYAAKRKSGRLDAIRPVLLDAGTLQRDEAQQIQKRRGRSEQYKHQYLLTDVIEERR